MTKKISKIVVFYDDGTFEEIKTVPEVKPNPYEKPFHAYPPGMRAPETIPPGFFSYKVTCGNE